MLWNPLISLKVLPSSKNELFKSSWNPLPESFQCPFNTFKLIMASPTPCLFPSPVEKKSLKGWGQAVLNEGGVSIRVWGNAMHGFKGILTAPKLHWTTCNALNDPETTLIPPKTIWSSSETTLQKLAWSFQKHPKHPYETSWSSWNTLKASDIVDTYMQTY